MESADMRKKRAWSDELFSKAVEFHGHRGPYLAVGLRMSLLALEKLDAQGWFDLRCRVFLPLKPPESCIVDGIQFSTGCTLGKRNIEMEEGDGIRVEFIKSEGRLRITLREEALSKIRSLLISDSVEKLLSWLANANETELFKIEYL